MTLLRRSPALRLALVASLALLFASTGSAQDTTLVPTPTLLKRIAEAVDGHRTGERVWVVASHDSLNPVRGVLTDRVRAEALARRLGPRYSAFGPYQAIRDPNSGWVTPGCQHDGRFSYMDPICPERLFARGNVTRMTLVIHLRGGTREEFPLDANVDALFLSLPAIDKFAIPYYARVLGIDSAAAMRTQIVRTIARQAPTATAPTGTPP